MEAGKVSADELNNYIKSEDHTNDSHPERVIQAVNGIDFGILEKQNQTLQKLFASTGFNVVATYGGPNNIGGYVKTNGDKTIYISSKSLEDPKWANYVLKHEENHLKTMFELPVEENFSENHNAIIKKLTGHSFLNDVDDFWLEGFNDLKTKQKTSGNEKSGYQKNISAVEVLNVWSNKILGGDKLMQAFASGNKFEFAYQLQILSNRLLLFDELVNIDESIFIEKDLDQTETQNLINQKILNYSGEVLDKEDAEQIIMAWIDEIALEQEVKAIKKSFQEPANDNKKSELLMVA